MSFISNLSNGMLNPSFLQLKSYKHCNKGGHFFLALMNVTKNVGGLGFHKFECNITSRFGLLMISCV
jgi:hypothetical protein